MKQVTRWLERYLAMEGITDEEHARVVRAGFVIAVVAMLLRVIFWVYTHRYWEDALITCLHSENLASGLGMTHVRSGEPPLHGFTSPLSVLVPLIGDLMHVGFGVEFLKLVSMFAGALTVLYVLAIGLHRSVRLPGPLILLVMGYVGFEHHQILWGMSGMETQLSTLILLMSVYYTIAWKPVYLGVSLGLCMLVRPDYAFWCLIVGVYILFKDYKQFPKIVAIALALYLPWIAFTLVHYGSPVPNTIIAKGLGYPKWWDKVDAINFFTLKRHTWIMLAEQLHVMLGPIFAGHGASIHIFFSNGPESLVGNLMFAFAVIGTLAILFRRQWTLWPLAGCVVVYSLYYVYLVPVIFGWYKVPYLATLLLLSVRGMQSVARLIPGGRVRILLAREDARPPTRLRTGVLAAFTAAYLGLFISVLPVCFLTERQIQQYVENDVRKAAGLYLAEHMKPDEAVGCEPLGYMGYYSRGNVYDWPGLASRTVVAWSKQQRREDRCLENMLKDLQPEYLFLRDLEVLYWFKDTQWLKDQYHVVAVFAIDPAAAKRIRWLDRNIDTAFRIYKRNRPEDVRPYDDSLWPRVPEGPPKAVTPPLTWEPKT